MHDNGPVPHHTKRGCQGKMLLTLTVVQRPLLSRERRGGAEKVHSADVINSNHRIQNIRVRQDQRPQLDIFAEIL